MFYTVYKITNVVNEKIYVGVHQTENLDGGYMGSGNLIKRAIRKYGVENFEKEYLAIFDNRDDMFDMEAIIVNEEFVTSSNTYNMKEGGFGGWIPGTNVKGNEAAVKKLQELHENDPEWVEQFLLKTQQGLREYYKTHPGSCSFKGKQHTSESKKKIGSANAKHQRGQGNSQFGTMWIYNPILEENKKIKKTDIIPHGWYKGRKKFK